MKPGRRVRPGMELVFERASPSPGPTRTASAGEGWGEGTPLSAEVLPADEGEPSPNLSQSYADGESGGRGTDPTRRLRFSLSGGELDLALEAYGDTHPCMFRSVFADPKLAAQYGGLHVNAVVTRTRKPRGGAANAGCANRTAKHPVCRAYFAGLHRTVADWASDSRSDRLDGKARTEPGERLNKRSQPLAGSIQHPKGACWIVKPVAECPVRSGVPPVRRGPRVRSSG